MKVELNWSTFILEIINFFVLVWILKHFLYVPIKQTVTLRQKIVDEKLNDAKNLETKATELQKTYENRLQDWGKEKEEKQKSFLQELEDWKSKERAKFLKNMDDDKEKIILREKQNINKIIDKNSRESMLLATKFVSRFLREFSDEHLESKIIDKIIIDLKKISKDDIQKIKNSLDSKNEILIQCAYSIHENQKKQLTEIIINVLNEKPEINFVVNPDILCGLLIQVGSVFLKANLRDELKYFAEVESAII